MIWALLGAAWASSCCSTAGITPSTLATCDRLGVSFGLSGEVETGGWDWAGAWSPVGDDGGQRFGASAALLVRAAPWMQAGLALQPAARFDALDGLVRRELALERAVLWADLETPAGFGGERAPRAALELGFGLADPAFEEEAYLAGLLGLRAGWESGPWGLWGAAALRLSPPRATQTDGGLVVDRRLSPKARLGLGLSVTASGGPFPVVESSLGPTAQWELGRSDRLTVGLRAGLPLPRAGLNATSRLMASVEWVRVLKGV